MKKTIKIVSVILLIIIAGITGIHIFLKNGLTKPFNTTLNKQTKQAIGVDSSIGKISIDLLNNNLLLKELQLKNPDGFFEPTSFFLKGIHASFDIRSFLRGIPKINSCDIEGIKLSIVRNESGTINWLMMQNKMEKSPKTKKETKIKTDGKAIDKATESDKEATIEQEEKEEEAKKEEKITRVSQKLSPLFLENGRSMH